MAITDTGATQQSAPIYAITEEDILSLAEQSDWPREAAREVLEHVQTALEVALDRIWPDVAWAVLVEHLGDPHLPEEDESYPLDLRTHDTD